MIDRELKQGLQKDYELSERRYSIGDRSITLYAVANNDQLLDRIDPNEFQKDERMPYWSEVWAAAIALSEFILSERSFQQARCLELGAGLGLVSIAAAIAGADVVATDYFTEALEFIQLNALTNQVNVKTRWLDWRDIDLDETFDYLLAADVLYESRNHVPILQAIDRLLSPTGTAYISDPDRTIAKSFVPLAVEHGFTVETLIQPMEWNDRVVSVHIYELSRFNPQNRTPT